jgi:hypothetical protein
LAVVFFLTLTDMMAIFAAPSWPDHHGLMTVVFVASLGLAVRMVECNLGGLSFGIAQALAVWLSPESLIPLMGLYSGLGLVWVIRGDKNLLTQCYRSSLGFIGIMALALGVEYGLDWPGFA